MNFSDLHISAMGLQKLAQVDAYQQETEWSCSAATLKAALLHHGFDFTEKELIKAIGARKGRGAETTDIMNGAKKLGFDAYEGSFKSLDDAKETLKKGIPIIADVQSFNYPGKGHYIVIAGFKPKKGFIVMDPNTKGKTAIDNWRLMPAEELEEKWWDRAMAPPHKLMPKWGVMVKPKTKEKTAGVKDFLTSARDASAIVPRTVKKVVLDKGLYASDKAGLIAGLAALPVGAAIAGYQVGKRKTANGDMLEYFQKNPKKLKEYQARQAAKKKGKRRVLPWGKEMSAQERFVASRSPNRPKEKKANDPVKEKLTLHGIPLALEWREGEVRKYFNHDPLKKKSTGTVDYNKKMKADYGYVRGIMDADGEELDVYLGPNRESLKVFVLEKLRNTDNSFDENKIMLGYDSMAEAKKSYLQHQGKDEMGKVRELTLEQFKKEFMAKKKTASGDSNEALRKAKQAQGDILGRNAMRRAKSESASAHPSFGKFAEAAFVDELCKIASAGTAMEALSIGGKAGGVLGGIGAAMDDDTTAGKVIKGIGYTALVGALVALGLQRNAIGKPTLPKF